MLILDTDHFSEILRGSLVGSELERRLASSDVDAATTIITIEEQSRGWLARIKQARNSGDRIRVYDRFHHMVSSAGTWTILKWDAVAASKLDVLIGLRLRVGTADLMIASIVLAHGGTHLSRNLADFQRVPGLDVRNWLE